MRPETVKKGKLVICTLSFNHFWYSSFIFSNSFILNGFKFKAFGVLFLSSQYYDIFINSYTHMKWLGVTEKCGDGKMSMENVKKRYQF